MQIPLLRGTKTDSKARFTDALMVNMVAYSDPVIGVSGYISSHYGLKDAGVCSGISRGGVFNDRFGIGFRVVGNSLVSLNDDGSQKDILGEILGSGQVSMPFSFNTQAVITQQGNMYLYDPVSGLKKISDIDLGSVFDGVWIDGYYFMVDSESPIVTDLLAENNIRQLNYGSAEIDPDPIIGCDKWRNFAVVFGSSTMEFYSNVGGTAFPFQRAESYTIYIGIIGTHAKAKLPNDDGFIVLGGSRNLKTSFYFAVNGKATSISTKSIDRILDTYSESELSSSKLEYVKNENQEFIYAHLKNHTLVYDITSSYKLGFRQWTIVKSGFYPQTDFAGFWQAINAIKMPKINNYSWGSRIKSVLCITDNSSSSQFGEQQEHIIYSPLIESPMLTLYSVTPQILNGTNQINREESIMLSTTQDGQSYSKEVSFNIGDRGSRWDQLIWRRIGYSKNWIGTKIRYVGKTNLTLANLEYNK